MANEFGKLDLTLAPDVDLDNTIIQSALDKLYYGIGRGQWNTDLTSAECKELYDFIYKLITDQND